METIWVPLTTMDPDGDKTTRFRHRYSISYNKRNPESWQIGHTTPIHTHILMKAMPTELTPAYKLLADTLRWWSTILLRHFSPNHLPRFIEARRFFGILAGFNEALGAISPDILCFWRLHILVISVSLAVIVTTPQLHILHRGRNRLNLMIVMPANIWPYLFSTYSVHTHTIDTSKSMFY